MISRSTFYVTPKGEGRPYRVTLERESDRCHARVERDDDVWSFTLGEGPAGDEVWIDGRPRRFRWDPATDGPGRLELDGLIHAMQVVDEAHRRASSIVTQDAGSKTAREVHSPIPGLVIAVEVEEGARVEEGDGIVIIEAMKMENEIGAPVPGVVRDLSITEGQAVEQNFLLCRIAPQGDVS